ncbi:hypothetical protein RRSWK_05512 [Rhodopirellula sp. SWK7]|nr:hypothetical protein RRSWK_05512 [Rhodopirellula sp. SWK7]
MFTDGFDSIGTPRLQRKWRSVVFAKRATHMNLLPQFQMTADNQRVHTERRWWLFTSGRLVSAAR